MFENIVCCHYWMWCFLSRLVSIARNICIFFGKGVNSAITLLPMSRITFVKMLAKC